MAGWRARIVAAGGVLLVSGRGPAGPRLPCGGVHGRRPRWCDPDGPSAVDRTVTTEGEDVQDLPDDDPAHASGWRPGTPSTSPRARAAATARLSAPTATYRGKWQMGASFWAAYGGKAYASRADLATCAEQDRVAYRGWVAAWWNPWGG